MDKKEKLEMLQKLSERVLTQKFLIPLYESEGMGCKNIRYTHRKLEFGKDIIYCKDDEHGNRIYTGVQVKRTKITTSDVDTIFRQICEAFGEPFKNLSDGKEKDLDRFVVLTSNGFLEEAKDSLWASVKGAKLDKFLTCIDGNQLVGLLDKHLPSAFWDEYDYFSKYFNALKTDFETIKDISAIGQKEPVPLENIYVSLRLIEKTREPEIRIEKEQRIFEEKPMKRKPQRHAEREKIIDADKAVKDYEKLVIVGAPGSGKTTLLKHFALRTCMENIEKRERACIPIPITLRDFSDSGKDLRKYIDLVFEKYQFPKAKQFVEKDLKEGRCRLLLDGFDELATKERQEDIAAKIRRLIDAYPKCQIIVTSRVAGYHDELKGFTKLQLMDFDDKQMEKFIENWFRKTAPEKAKSMSAAIKRNAKIKELAKNPLMIAIIAIIYEEDKKLPQKRAALYTRCVEVLLSRWDVQKRLKNVYPMEKKEFILRKLAFYGHSNNKRVITEKEVMAEISKHLPRLQLNQEDVKPLLDEIWQRSYLLRQISIDSYDFLNLSFQEFFTGLELKEAEDGTATIIKHLDETWWEESILLYAGITKDATPLINRIKEGVPEDMFYSNLLLYGKCIADTDFTDPDLKEKIVSELFSLYKKAEYSSLKEKAIDVLSLTKPDSVIGGLIRDLHDKRMLVRSGAAMALGRIGSEKAVEPLIKALTDKASGVGWNAAIALGEIGSEEAVGPLIKALATDEEEDARRRAAMALGRIGSEKAVEPLIKALTDKASGVGWNAAEALGRIGGKKAIEPLIKALATDEEGIVRMNAAEALGEIRSEETVEPLIKALTDKASGVRTSAAIALGKIGSDKAVEPLIKALSAKKASEARWSAAMALGDIGSEKAVKPLIKALATDKAREVRGSAAMALGEIGGKEVVEPLIKALATDKEGEVRGSAAMALGEIGGKGAVESLIKALTTDKEGEVRWYAADSLGEIGGKEAVESLIKALTTDKEGEVRRTAAEKLGEVGSEEVVEPLIKALTTDKESEVRWHAAEALGNFENKEAMEALKRALGDEGDFYGMKVKDTAFISLERISRRLRENPGRIKLNLVT